MSLLDKVVAHGAIDVLRHVDVPEWGDEGQPLRLFYTPLSLAEMSDVHQMDPAKWHHQAARIVALKALDENRVRLFKTIDAVTLRQQGDRDVVTRIAVAILGNMTVEQAEKN